MRRVLKLGNRLSMLKINDCWWWIDREAPQLVVGFQRVSNGVEEVIGYASLPIQRGVKGRFRNHSERIFSALNRWKRNLILSPAFGEICTHSVQWSWRNFTWVCDAV